MIYEPFSIVVVPFPFTDKHNMKRRPALVLSSILHQEQTDHITLLMITSAKHSGWKSDYAIQDLQSTHLTSPSIIRQKIFTIDNRLLIGVLGKLSSKDEKGIAQRLKAHLSFKV